MRFDVTRLAILALASASLVSACGDNSKPSPAVESFTDDGARVVRPRSGALTEPSVLAVHDIVQDYLGTNADLQLIDRASRLGITHVRFEQQIDGLRVHNTYVKAAVNDRGELVQVIERLATVDGALAMPTIDATTAIAATFAHLGYVEQPIETATKNHFHVFARGTVFYREPTAELVAYRDDAGHARTGYLVETWSRAGNILDETLVDGSGAVIATERRTQRDSYNVFLEDPSKGGQVVVQGGGAESPAGWLFAGSHTTTNIAGNNVHAYLDTDANNAPDPGGTTVTDGNFLSVADLTVQPSTTGNRNVAVQNLFYLNNRIHDVLYRHGFTETTGNFQESNFGFGRRGSSDPVNAEAQDGGGTDNANFATPRDGSSPRMQMYLWSSPIPSFTLAVGGQTFPTYGSSFGPQTANATGTLVLANDGVGTASDGCEALSGYTGQIVLVDRGTCNFTVKVKNAQLAGAVAVIIANNQGGDTAFAPGGTDATITIPSGMVTQNQGATLKGLLGQSASLTTTPSENRIMLDGDLDSDIVYHEYGHGLTWRMIGSMGGAMSGAIGEGASDALAFLMNGDDRIGEYSFGNPLGIRSQPYATYDSNPKNSYGKLYPLTEVHADGELYAAILYRLMLAYQAAGLTADDLLDDWVNGMNFTPSGPAYENMRDGQLQGTPEARDCMVWEAYAHFGVGVGAKYTSKGKTPGIVESFAVPPECQ